MNLTRRHLPALAVLSLLILVAGCSDRDPAGLPVARAKIDPLVFDDAYSDDVYFQAFFETNLTAVAMDSVYAYNGYAPDGSRSLKVTVAPEGSSLGAYSGGVLTSSGARDLADYNALTFYARAEVPIAFNELGFGNDNTGTSLYSAGRGNVALDPEWKFVVVPIPAPSKLVSERGLFTFAEGLETDAQGAVLHPGGYHVWFDEIRFARLGNVEVYRPSLTTVTGQYFVGSEVVVQDTKTVFRVDGAFVTVNHAPGYFDFTSDNPAVAQVVGDRIAIRSEGQATVKATLDTLNVIGQVNVTGYLPPATAAARPTLPAADVISMFSDAYLDVPVDTWNPHWAGSRTQDALYVVDGDETRMYSSLDYVGILFQNPVIDASAMTHLHLDVYAPAGAHFKVKLGCYPGGAATAVETPDLVLDATTTPAFVAGSWVSLDIPLEMFVLPGTWDWTTVGLLVLSSNFPPVAAEYANLVLVDNIYWHK